ncbi:reverse transcriptase domain-containing protein [Tanacetum coccineum]
MDIRMSRLEKMICEKNTTTPATVKAVEEVCVTCGANHNFNNCLLTRSGNDFPVFHDNIHQFQQTAAVGNFVQRNPLNLANQIRPPGFNQSNVQNNQGNQSRYQGNNFNSNQKNRGRQFQSKPSKQSRAKEDSIFMEIPKPKAKKIVNVEIQDLNSPRPNSYQSKLPYPERIKVRENDKPIQPNGYSSLLKNKQKLEEISITTVNAECSAIIMNKVPEKLEDPRKFLILCEDVVVRVDGFTFLADFVVVNFEPDPRVPIILGKPFLRTAKALIDLYEEKLTLRVGKDELVYYADKSEKNKEKNFVHAISIIDFSKDDPFSGSTTNTLPPSSSPVKTSDNLEKFADELAPLDSLPPGNDDSTLKKDFHEVNFQVYSNPLFEFDDNFKSSKVNPLFEENDKDAEIKSSSSFTLTSPEVSKLEAYLAKDSIPPGINLTLPPTFEVSSSNPTSPTLTGEKVCSWKTPMFFSLVRFVWKMMTRIAIRKKIICLLATFLNKKPKLLSSPQEVEEIKENEEEISSDVPIHTIVMPIRITFDNPIDFNDNFSKPKDFKKDLTVSFDSSKSSILPSPLLDSDSPFTAELSASVTLNSLRNEDKVFKPVFKEPSFLLPPPEPPDECLTFKSNLVMKNVVLNNDFYQSNVEDVNSFTLIIWIFLPYFTYTKDSPLIFSFGSENFIFDPGIVTFHKTVDQPNKFFEASRVRLIYPVLLELLILCVKLVWGNPISFHLID